MEISDEKQLAMKEGIVKRLSDEYFKARPQLDSVHNRVIFETGADRMYYWLLNTKKDNGYDPSSPNGFD